MGTLRPSTDAVQPGVRASSKTTSVGATVSTSRTTTPSASREIRTGTTTPPASGDLGTSAFPLLVTTAWGPASRSIPISCRIASSEDPATAHDVTPYVLGHGWIRRYMSMVGTSPAPGTSAFSTITPAGTSSGAITVEVSSAPPPELARTPHRVAINWRRCFRPVRPSPCVVPMGARSLPSADATNACSRVTRFSYPSTDAIRTIRGSRAPASREKDSARFGVTRCDQTWYESVSTSACVLPDASARTRTS